MSLPEGAPQAALFSSGQTQFKRIGPWKGMNEKIAADALAEGMAAQVVNMMLDEQPGVGVKRWGSTKQAALPSALPPRDTYVFTAEDGNTWQLVSDGATLYSCVDPANAATYVQLLTGLNPNGFMEFVTAENKVWMSNGTDPFMSWDGSLLIIYDNAFTSANNLTTVDTTHFTDSNLGAVDNLWNGQQLVFIVGSNVGTVVTVTAYNGTTKEITFTPAVSNISATDRYMVGVIIPQGKSLRFYDGHIFVGNTTENVAELRFNLLSDPNTGALMSIANPQAWPASNELAANVLDQQQICGISPILRDRILVFKASGLWRVERDPLVTYRLESVSQEIGSQYQDTWAEKNNLLYFLGQAKDGYPDIFKTDMMDVEPVDLDGGVEPTLRSLQQPNTVQKRLSFTSQADFATGSESTSVAPQAGLNITGDTPAPISQTNVDTAKSNGSVGYNGLLGIPQWTGKWDGRSGLLPSAASPAWTLISNPPINGVWVSPLAGGVLKDIGAGFSEKTVSISGIFNPAQSAVLAVECIMGDSLFLQVANGSKSAWIQFENGFFWIVSDPVSVFARTFSFNPNASHVFTLQLLTSGNFSVWIDGVLLISGIAANTVLSTNIAKFGPSLVFTAPGSTSYAADPSLNTGGSEGTAAYKRAYYAASSSSGVPASILQIGALVVQYDYTRTPDALHKIYADYNPDIYLAGCVVTTASPTVQLNSGVDMTQLSMGQTVNLRNTLTGELITNGSARVIQSVNAGAFTITLDGAGGNVSTDANMAVYLANAAMAITTWTSSDPNFATGNDPAGYVAVVNGAQPTSLVLRYMRVKLAFSFPDLMTSTQINGLYVGMLWLSPPISLPNISAWLTFLDTILTPAGVDQTIKIRNATVGPSPSEGQWNSWLTIASGNNIGTILGDAPPPTSTWVQIKVEQGASSVGLLPVVEALVVNWLTGAAQILPARAIVHKKRYMLTAALATSKTNNIIIIHDRNDQWAKWQGLALNAMVHLNGILYGLDAADSYQRVMDISGHLDDDGVAINAYLIDRQDTMGFPHLRKNFRWSYLLSQATASAWGLTTSFLLTGWSAFSSGIQFAMGALGLDVRQNFPIGTVGKRIQRQYANNNVDENMALEGEIIYFDVRPLQP